MNQTIPAVKTVHVRLLNLDEQQFAIFRMAFKMHNTTDYLLVQEGDAREPELVLVDGDVRAGAEQWQAARQRFANAKVVFFARQPPVFTAPYLAKPIRFDTLFFSLRNLLQGNGVWVAGSSGQAAASPADGTAGAHFTKQDDRRALATATDLPAPVADPAATESLDKPPVRQETVSVSSFSTKGTLLGLVQQVMQQEQNTVVAVDGKPVLVIFPALKRALLAVEAEKIQAFCAQPDLVLSTKAMALDAALREKAKIKTQALVWQLAIWTVQGRLIDPVGPDTLLQMKSWPNMTRMAFLPEATRLSAFLVKTPASLLMLYKLLPLDIRDILNFIAAAYASGYLNIEQPLEQRIQQREAETLLSRNTANQTPIETAAGKSDSVPQSRGLLQRLMGRLRGK